MTINVTSVGEGWKATPTSDPLFTITVEGQSEPQKTYDAELAKVGTHEAESYQSKTGKTYWRKPGSSGSYRPQQAKVFKADPEKQESIEWQACLKAAVETIHNYHAIYGDGTRPDLAKYKAEIVNCLVTFTQAIDHKPTQPVAVPEPLPTDEEVDNFSLEDLPL